MLIITTQDGELKRFPNITKLENATMIAQQFKARAALLDCDNGKVDTLPLRVQVFLHPIGNGKWRCHYSE